MSHYLTIDLGSTYFKAALFDAAGQLTDLAQVAVPIERPQAGQFELPGHLFEQTIIALLGKLRAQSLVGFAQVQAISFATQANSFRLLDAKDQLLSPLILWLDQRAKGMQEKLDRISQRESYYQQTGMTKLNGQGLLSQLMYLAQTGPSSPSLGQVKRVCLISDLLTLWLTGQHVTPVCVAGLTGMANIHTLQWLDFVVQSTGLDVSCFGRIVLAGTDLGLIAASAAAQLGLPKSCRFVVGCLDQYAGALGCDNLLPGSLSETTGTVLATVRCSDAFDTQRADLYQAPMPAVGGMPGVPGVPGVTPGAGVPGGAYYQMDFGSRSANMLEHYQRHFAQHLSFAQLDQLASNVPAGVEGLSVCDEPLTSGQMFVGRSKQHTIGHEVRAILEDVAKTLEQQVKHVCQNNMPSAIVSAGGAAQSDLWQQIKADQLKLPFHVMQCAQPTSLGAALLGAQAVQSTSIAKLAQTWIQKRKTYWPA